MSFYVCPPLEVTNIETVVTDVHNRLKLLNVISQCNGNVSILQKHLTQLSVACDSDGFIEHTPRDTTASFMLQVFAASNASLGEFLCQSEQLLFVYRLQCQRSLLSPLSLLRQEVLHASAVLRAGPRLGQALRDVKVILEEVLAMRCVGEERRCGKCLLTASWQVAPGLVSKRQVVLVAGRCQLRCRRVLDLLAELFLHLLQHQLHHLGAQQQLERLQQHSLHLHDKLARVVRVFERCGRGEQHSSTAAGLSVLLSDQVPRAARLFPPCMRQLQSLLCRHRRLQHHQRYRYTVFLRDVGVPLHENIRHWAQHYSAPASHLSCGCCHSWQQHATRYTYSVRHVYGLEGRRVPAGAHSCSCLQKMTPQPGDCGGCPFAAAVVTEPWSSSQGVFSEEEQQLLLSRGEDVSVSEVDAGRNSCSSSIKRSHSSQDCADNSSRRKFYKCDTFTGNALNEEVSSSQSILVDINGSVTNCDYNSLGKCSLSSAKLGKCSPKSTSILSTLSSSHNKDVYNSSSKLSHQHDYYKTSLGTSVLSKRSLSLSRNNLRPVLLTDCYSSQSLSSSAPRTPCTPASLHLQQVLAEYGLPPHLVNLVTSVASDGRPMLACRMTLAWQMAQVEKEGRRAGTGADGGKVAPKSSIDGGISTGAQQKARVTAVNSCDHKASETNRDNVCDNGNISGRPHAEVNKLVGGHKSGNLYDVKATNVTDNIDGLANVMTSIEEPFCNKIIQSRLNNSNNSNGYHKIDMSRLSDRIICNAVNKENIEQKDEEAKNDMVLDLTDRAALCYVGSQHRRTLPSTQFKAIKLPRNELVRKMLCRTDSAVEQIDIKKASVSNIIHFGRRKRLKLIENSCLNLAEGVRYENTLPSASKQAEDSIIYKTDYGSSECFAASVIAKPRHEHLQQYKYISTGTAVDANANKHLPYNVNDGSCFGDSIVNKGCSSAVNLDTPKRGCAHSDNSVQDLLDENTAFDTDYDALAGGSSLGNSCGVHILPESRQFKNLDKIGNINNSNGNDGAASGRFLCDCVENENERLCNVNDENCCSSGNSHLSCQSSVERWLQRALDVSDSKLNFASPAQYYAVLHGYQLQQEKNVSLAAGDGGDKRGDKTI